MSRNKEPRDHWSEDGQIFYTYGKGYGLTDKLETIYLGKEEDIEEYLATGQFGLNFNPLQRQVLRKVLDYRKELGIGTVHTTGTAGLERAIDNGATGRKSKATRLSQKRKRLPLRPPRTKNKGLSRR